jgi:DnaJ-class molecular chaperone
LDGNGNLITAMDQLRATVADSADADMKMSIECTLEEFFYGCLKEISFERFIVSKTAPSGYITQKHKRMIEVRPGMGAKELRFSGEGHLRFGKAQGDLFVSIEQKQHNKFKRQGDDLVYRHKISLVDSLKSQPIHFTTIDNEHIEVAVDEIISPQS